MNSPLSRSLVRSLFLIGCPFAVFLKVTEVVINPLNGVPSTISRLTPHIIKKIRKGIKPAFADFYSSSTPVLELLGVGVGASTDHVSPGTVLQRIYEAVLKLGVPSPFSLKTAAAFGDTKSYVSSVNNYFVSAITNTVPASCSVFSDMRELKDGQPCKSLPRNVLEVSRSFYDQFISHKLTPIWFLVRAHFQRLTGDGLELLSRTNWSGAT